MSLTKPIPPKMRLEMANDPFYQYCCIEDENCEGRIEWHHNLRSWLNKNVGRVNVIFCILPVCSFHHRKADTKIVKQLLDQIMWDRASEEEKIKWQIKT